MTHPKPVAAVLRDSGHWSLESPLRRFDAEDYWYRADFEVDAADIGAEHSLQFGGLATIADVWLNGHALLHSENMHVQHDVNVSSLLKPKNQLLIRFTALDRALSWRRPRPRWRVPMIEQQQLRWVRTTLLGRTPGWSPAAAIVGPWREISLYRHSSVKVEQLSVKTSVDRTDGLVDIECHIQTIGNARIADVQLRVGCEGAWSTGFLAELSADVARFEGKLRVPEVALWWPHTHGEPSLYQALLRVRLAGQAEPVDIDLGLLGFRTISVDHSNDRFSLRVNDVPVFCRGACWTPLDVVEPTRPSEELRNALTQLRDAGMNMVRIAGTMLYEDDTFFELCDELGLLVWQDFMFANMDYPGEDAEFLKSVEFEVRQRLSHFQAHPSLAVLCGNSEGEQQAAMWGAPRQQWYPPLFHEHIATWARQMCPDVPYWPSSAHGGAYPHQWNVGTTSYYGVGAYLRPLGDARQSEVSFATECLAFANIPEDDTIARQPGGLALRAHHAEWKRRSPRDLGAGWDFDDIRDHYLEQLFEVDARRLRYSDHERYVTLGRVVTGEVMAAAYAQWRREDSRCGGALIWFLRDLWAGAGWGVIDDRGHPKACFYYLKRILQPITTLIADEGGSGLFAHVVNETPRPVEAILQMKAYRADGSVGAHGEKPLSLAPHASLKLPLAELLEGFEDLNWAYRFGPAAYEVIMTSLHVDADCVARAFSFPLGLSLAPQHDLGLMATARIGSDNAVEIDIRTDQFAQSVYFEAPGYVADDAYFHLEPQGTRTVRLRAVAPSRAGFRGSLRAVNLIGSVPIRVAA